jgi:predicted nucleic acid-binding protein
VILVDSSVWIDHLRKTEPMLEALLLDGRVLVHPFVVGELALGNLRQRGTILDALLALPRSDAVTDEELLLFVDLHGLSGHGIGLVDAHLLAAVMLMPDAGLGPATMRLMAGGRNACGSQPISPESSPSSTESTDRGHMTSHGASAILDVLAREPVSTHARDQPRSERHQGRDLRHGWLCSPTRRRSMRPAWARVFVRISRAGRAFRALLG